MDNIAEIKEFLAAQNCLVIQSGIVFYDMDIVHARYPEQAALKATLNHWLSKQLGIHWQQLWAWARFVGDTFFYDAFEDEHIAAIEKAIAWHEALEKELDKDLNDSFKQGE